MVNSCLKIFNQKLPSEMHDQNKWPSAAGLLRHLGQSGLVPGYILANFSFEKCNQCNDFELDDTMSYAEKGGMYMF